MGKHPLAARRPAAERPPAPLKLPYRLSVCGKSEVEEFSHQAITHLLSLEDPGTPQDTPDWFKGVHWQFHFHDLESVSDAFMMGGTIVTRDQVAQLLRCGEECRNASRQGRVHLLVHCFAGASRSTAACFALAAQALGPGRAQEALDYVVSIRPEAFPNLLVVRYADKLLGRGGELLRALRSHREGFRSALEAWVKSLEKSSPDS
jgi:predicted protein tyrosine phosphatase